MFESISSAVAWLLVFVLVLSFRLSRFHESRRSLRLRTLDLVYNKYWKKIEFVFYKLDEQAQKKLNKIYSDMVIELKEFKISKEDLNSYIISKKSKLKVNGIIYLVFSSLVVPYFFKNLSEVDLIAFIKDLFLGTYNLELNLLLTVIIFLLVACIHVIILFRVELTKSNQKLPVLEDLYNFWDNVDVREVESQNDNNSFVKKSLTDKKLKLTDIIKIIFVLLLIFTLAFIIASLIFVGLSFFIAQYPIYVICIEIISLFLYYLYVKIRR